MPQNCAFAANSEKCQIFLQISIFSLHKFGILSQNAAKKEFPIFMPCLGLSHWIKSKITVYFKCQCWCPIKFWNSWKLQKMQKFCPPYEVRAFLQILILAAKSTHNFENFSKPCRKISRNLPQISEVLNYCSIQLLNYYEL